MSNSEMKLGQSASATVVKNKNGAHSDLNDLAGYYVVEHWRSGQRINEYHFHNFITNEGKNHILDVQFHATAALTTWYMGLIDNLLYGTIAVDDTYVDIDQAENDWDEFKLYDLVTRPEWDEAAASAQAMTNNTVTVFDISGSGTVKGLFLCAGTNAATKGDHTAGVAHKLWATALFSGDVAVLDDDQLKVTYTISA